MDLPIKAPVITEPDMEIDTFILNVTNNSNLNISSIYPELPYYLTFNEESVLEVVLYSLMFVLAAGGNLPVFVTLIRNRHRKSRINLMIMHLAIADLIVTFIMIPLEIAWRITVAWVAGNVFCKVMLYMRAFGPYLSSMILVCISLDRYFAILHPLKVNDAQRRGKVMIIFAWSISILCSIPQSVIFHVENHPDYPQFLQCVSFNFFPSLYHKMAYNIFCLLALYGVPLLIIIACYSRILWEISRRSRESDGDLSQEPRYRQRLCLRRSDIAHIERARARTLRMTIIIVLTFFGCWTPYVVIVLWYVFDPVSADKVDSRIQSSLFMFAVSNSCVNPLVYGSYVLSFKEVFKSIFCRKQASNIRSANHTGITTPAKRTPIKEPMQKAISVHLSLNGIDTYSSLVKKEDILIMSNMQQHHNSCRKLPNESRTCCSQTKTEANVHSLDH